MLKEKDKVIIKGLEGVGTIKRVYKDLNVAIVDFGGDTLKVILDELTPYKEETEIGSTADKIGEGEITVTGMDFCRAQLEVCTPEYIKAHCANADECTSIDWGIVAASGAVVSNLLWDYLRGMK